ncbi:MAG: hypothetical protein RR022_07510 [Angelakisella sp.]
MNSLAKRRIDLYESFFVREKASRAQKNRFAQIAFPCLLALLLGSAGLWLHYEANQMNRASAPVNTFLQDTATVSLYQKAQALDTLQTQLTAQRDNLTATIALADSTPTLTQAQLDALFDNLPNKAQVISFSCEGDGLLTAQLVGTLAEDAANYAAALKRTGLFASVTHSGYEGQAGVTLIVDKETVITDGAYNSNVVLGLKPPNAEQDGNAEVGK